MTAADAALGRPGSGPGSQPGPRMGSRPGSGPGSRLASRLASVLPNRHTLGTMRRSPRKDLLAGLTVAIVALPLALGFGISSGAGAEAGLAIAVVAGALAAVFGGSNLQLTLGDAITALQRRGTLVLVSGIRDEHHRPLDALAILHRLRADGRVFDTTPDAIGYARAHLDGQGIPDAMTPASRHRSTR